MFYNTTSGCAKNFVQAPGTASWKHHVYLRHSQTAHIPTAQTRLAGANAASMAEDAGYLLRLERAMETAALVSSHREKSETARRRNQVMTEYKGWLQTIPELRRPSLLSSTGYDVLQFLVEHWAVHHGGRAALTSGIVQATPGYLAGTVASLATGFREQGLSNSANPALQLPVNSSLSIITIPLPARPHTFACDLVMRPVLFHLHLSQHTQLGS